MKSKRLKTTKYGILILLALLPCSQAFCQTGTNYALAGIGFNFSHSIIRSISDTDAVTYYETDSTNWIARINTAGGIRQIPIGNDIDVRDLRIAGDHAYFCGQKQGKACIGRIPLAGFFNTSTTSAEVHLLDPDHISDLTRLAAYTQGAEEKVTAIGHLEYTDSPFYSNGLADSARSSSHYIVVEGQFPSGSAPSFELLALTSGHERLDEVIATRSYVAIIGMEDGRITIHRCSKSQVLLTFNQYHAYSFTGSEGLSPFTGCLMPLDSIAIVSMSVDTQSGSFGTRLRTFDLASMLNVQAQEIGPHEKSAPYEITYLPQHQTVVMLHEKFFSTASFNTPFVYWTPAALSAGNAKLIGDSHSPAGFASISYLGSDRYVASGGDYWMTKHLPADVTPSNCYSTDSMPFTPIPVAFETSMQIAVQPITLSHTPLGTICNIYTPSISINCVQSNINTF